MSNSRTQTPHTSPPSSPPPIRRTISRRRGPFQEQSPIARTQSNNSLASNTSAFSVPVTRRTRYEESLNRAMSQMHIQRPMPPPLDFYLNNSRHFAPIQPDTRTNARTNTRTNTRINRRNNEDSDHYVSSNASSSSRSSDSSYTRERRAIIRLNRRRARRTRRRIRR